MIVALTTRASPHAAAADFRINISSGYHNLAIEGVIEAGDYERFTKIAKDNQGQLAGIYIPPPGGDFLEAMKIGRAVRALELGQGYTSARISLREARQGNVRQTPVHCRSACSRRMAR